MNINNLKNLDKIKREVIKMLKTKKENKKVDKNTTKKATKKIVKKDNKFKSNYKFDDLKLEIINNIDFESVKKNNLILAYYTPKEVKEFYPENEEGKFPHNVDILDVISITKNQIKAISVYTQVKFIFLKEDFENMNAENLEFRVYKEI